MISFHNSALGNVLLLKAIELVSFSFVFILRSLSFFSFSYSSHSHSFIICFFFPLFSLHFFPISFSFCYVIPFMRASRHPTSHHHFKFISRVSRFACLVAIYHDKLKIIHYNFACCSINPALVFSFPNLKTNPSSEPYVNIPECYDD